MTAEYANIEEHVRKMHSHDDEFTQEAAVALGMVKCNCGQIVKQTGLMHHRNFAKCTQNVVPLSNGNTPELAMDRRGRATRRHRASIQPRTRAPPGMTTRPRTIRQTPSRACDHFETSSSSDDESTSESDSSNQEFGFQIPSDDDNQIPPLRVRLQHRIQNENDRNHNDAQQENRSPANASDNEETAHRADFSFPTSPTSPRLSRAAEDLHTEAPLTTSTPTTASSDSSSDSSYTDDATSAASMDDWLENQDEDEQHLEQAWLPQESDNDETWFQKFTLLRKLPERQRVLSKREKTIVIRKLEQMMDDYLRTDDTTTLYQILVFPKIVLASTLKFSKLKKRIDAYPQISRAHNLDLRSNEGSETNRNGESRLRLGKMLDKAIANGYISKAAKLLQQNAVAESTPEVVQALQRLHPEENFNPRIPTTQRRHPKISNPVVKRTLNRLSHETSGAFSGWNGKLAKLMARSETFHDFLTKLSNLLLLGKLPLRRILRTSRLIALTKPGHTQDNPKLRPIAVGELFYRLAATTVVRTLIQKDTLLPTQLGVGTPLGVEPMIALQSHALHHDHGLIMLDLANAFNSVRRHYIHQSVKNWAPGLEKSFLWAYSGPSDLIMADGSRCTSSSGVRQGDPLSALLFSIAYRQKLTELQDTLNDNFGQIPARTVSYIDDTSVRTKVHNTDAALDLIEQVFRRDQDVTGLRLNLAKTTVIKSIDEECKIGGAVIGNLQARRRFVETKVADTIALLNTLSTSHAKAQTKWLIFSKALAPKLLHLLRTMDNDGCQDIWTGLDAEHHRMIASLTRNMGPNQYNELQQLLIHLPRMHGGLGVPSYVQLSNPARQAHLDQTNDFLRQNFDYDTGRTAEVSTQKERTQQITKENFDRVHEIGTDMELITLADNANTIGTKWLDCKPIDSMKILSEADVAVGILDRLLIPPGTASCTHCHNTINLGHAECCTMDGGINTDRISRHEEIKKILATGMRARKCKVQLEPFATQHDENMHLRADIRATGRVLQGTMNYDVTICCATQNKYHQKRQNILREISDARTAYYRAAMVALDEREKAKSF